MKVALRWTKQSAGTWQGQQAKQQGLRGEKRPRTMDKHSRVPVSKRAFGVSIIMAGGLNGYSEGKRSFPMYQPPAFS